MTRSHGKRLAALAVLLALSAPSASASTVIDLTSRGANNFETNNTAAFGGTFFVQQTDFESAEGGVIDSFVRLKSHGRREQGYNTDARPTQFNEKGSPSVTHSLLLSEVPKVDLTVGGVTETYRQFVLDINQLKSQPFLSLNQIQIFLRDAGDLENGELLPNSGTRTEPPVIAFVDPFSIEVFQLNTNREDESFYEIQLKDRHGENRGPGDMFLYVRDAAFQAALAEEPDFQYVYLYSQFGRRPGEYKTNGRFEEWGVIKQPPVPVPEPPAIALALSGLGTLGLARLGYRRQALRMTA